MEAQLDTHGDAAVLRVEAPSGGATAATGAFRGGVSIDPGNLLVSDVAGPPADALQVCTCPHCNVAVWRVCVSHHTAWVGAHAQRRRAHNKAAAHFAALTPPFSHQADATAACLAHGRDVLQRLLVRLPPWVPVVLVSLAAAGREGRPPLRPEPPSDPPSARLA